MTKQYIFGQSQKRMLLSAQLLSTHIVQMCIYASNCYWAEPSVRLRTMMQNWCNTQFFVSALLLLFSLFFVVNYCVVVDFVCLENPKTLFIPFHHSSCVFVCVFLGLYFFGKIIIRLRFIFFYSCFSGIAFHPKTSINASKRV